MAGGRPLQIGRVGRRQTLAFALLGTALPIAIATATDFGSHRTAFFIGAAIACAVPVVVTLVPRRHRLPYYLAAFGGIPALTLMQSDSGGVASGYSVLLMMAMIWFGLRATDRELLAGLGMLAACCFAPMLVIGAPEYPVSWGHAALLVLVGTAVAGSLRTLVRQTQGLTESLRREAVGDDLTGLLNRRGWREAAKPALAQAARRRAPAGLIVLDLDQLKQVNDSMGHDEGDRLLRETADRLTAALRNSDIVARLGGDEFAALLCDAPLDRTIGTLERLRQATPKLGRFSAGVASWNGLESLDELLRRADLALYEAKSGGGDGLRVAPQPLAADRIPD